MAIHMQHTYAYAAPQSASNTAYRTPRHASHADALEKILKMHYYTKGYCTDKHKSLHRKLTSNAGRRSRVLSSNLF